MEEASGGGKQQNVWKNRPEPLCRRDGEARRNEIKRLLLCASAPLRLECCLFTASQADSSRREAERRALTIHYPTKHCSIEDEMALIRKLWRLTNILMKAQNGALTLRNQTDYKCSHYVTENKRAKQKRC